MRKKDIFGGWKMSVGLWVFEKKYELFMLVKIDLFIVFDVVSENRL